MSIKEQVECLKNNAIVFGELSQEDQSLFWVVGKKNCLWRGAKDWEVASLHGFMEENTYRVKKDFVYNDFERNQNSEEYVGEVKEVFGKGLCVMGGSGLDELPIFEILSYPELKAIIGPDDKRYAVDEWPNMRRIIWGKLCWPKAFVFENRKD